jgi:hypothetical protein
MFEALKKIKGIVAHLFRRLPPSGPTQDPYAGVREPRKRGPAGGHAGVAVMEPEPDRPARADGRFPRQ